jgi:hypothetical protein
MRNLALAATLFFLAFQIKNIATKGPQKLLDDGILISGQNQQAAKKLLGIRASFLAS